MEEGATSAETLSPSPLNEDVMCVWREVSGGDGRKGWIATRKIERGMVIMADEEPLYIAYSIIDAEETTMTAYHEAYLKWLSWFKTGDEEYDTKVIEELPSASRVIFMPRITKGMLEHGIPVHEEHPCPVCCMSQYMSQTLHSDHFALLKATYEAVPSHVPGGGCVQVYSAYNDDDAVSDVCAHFMADVLGEENEVLHRILDRNLIRLQCASAPHGTLGYAFYPNIARVQHRCLFPNAAFVNDTHRGHLVAVRDIEEGEEITRQYVCEPRMNMKERRLHLFEQFGINCKCEDCEKWRVLSNKEKEWRLHMKQNYGVSSKSEDYNGWRPIWIKEIDQHEEAFKDILWLEEYDTCLSASGMTTPTEARLRKRRELNEKVAAGSHATHRLSYDATNDISREVLRRIHLELMTEVRSVSEKYKLKERAEQGKRFYPRSVSEQERHGVLAPMAALFAYARDLLCIFVYEAHLSFLGEHIHPMTDALFAAFYVLYQMEYYCGPHDIIPVHVLSCIGYSYAAYSPSGEKPDEQELDERINLAVVAHERFYTFLRGMFRDKDVVRQLMQMESRYSELYRSTLHLSHRNRQRAEMNANIMQMFQMTFKTISDEWLAGTAGASAGGGGGGGGKAKKTKKKKSKAKKKKKH